MKEDEHEFRCGDDGYVGVTQDEISSFCARCRLFPLTRQDRPALKTGGHDLARPEHEEDVRGAELLEDGTL